MTDKEALNLKMGDRVQMGPEAPMGTVKSIQWRRNWLGMRTDMGFMVTFDGYPEINPTWWDFVYSYVLGSGPNNEWIVFGDKR